MSSNKSNYPERPADKRRPKSSTRGGGKKKTWMSLRTKVDGGRDISPRMAFSWFQSPYYWFGKFNIPREYWGV